MMIYILDICLFEALCSRYILLNKEKQKAIQAIHAHYHNYIITFTRTSLSSCEPKMFL